MKKPFATKPWTAGAAISWVHFYPDGTSILRTGTVWDKAPTVSGTTMAVWVIPDERLTSDIYTAVAVGKSSKRYNGVHGKHWPEVTQPRINKGETFSSNYAGSPLGWLATTAARRAYEVRRAVGATA